MLQIVCYGSVIDTLSMYLKYKAYFSELGSKWKNAAEEVVCALDKAFVKVFSSFHFQSKR